jgi:hypothetical protein
VRPRSWKTVLATTIAVASIAAAVPAHAGPGNPGVVGVNTSVLGQTYAQWSVAWWQWVFDTRFDAGPFGDGPVDCSVNQPNPNVLFLAGPFNSSGTIDRTCTETLTTSTYIFLPVVNAECSNIEGAPFFGADAAARRACATGFKLNALRASVDGKPVTQLKDFTVTSDDFAFTAIADNPGIADVNPAHTPPWTGSSTSSGVWLMLEPLAPGDHTIQFQGKFPLFKYTLDVTYHVTVTG